MLALNALRGRQDAFVARAIDTGPGHPPLAAKLAIATSAQRPRGPLIDQANQLVCSTCCGGCCCRRPDQPALATNAGRVRVQVRSMVPSLPRSSDSTIVPSP